MTLTTQRGLPPLNANIEGLRSHSLLVGIFVPEPDVSPEQRKWRSWLVHCLVKASRHYNEARDLIQAQLDEAMRPSADLARGRLLPMLDFALAMEDCVTSLEKAIVCIRALKSNGQVQVAKVLELESDLGLINSFRRQQEHMHTQLAAGQTGGGPIVLTVGDDGQSMKLRNLTMSFSALHRVVNVLYRDIATFFPVHSVDSVVKERGVVQLSMSVTVTVSQGKPEPPMQS